MVKNNTIGSYINALNWIKNNTLREQGVIANSLQRVPYLEVTGYLIPTLLDAGEKKLAEQYADFLSYIQRPNGSFAGTDGKQYIFDSAQALRGLARATQQWERFKEPARKTADYLISMMEPSGRLPASYGGFIPEFVHLFCLPALHEAGRVLNNDSYVQAAIKATTYYKSQPSVLHENVLTHFLSYIIDGLIDMGEKEFVRPVVEKIFSRQHRNGSISAFPDVHWVCSTGLAQLAIIAYKMGMVEQADSAVKYVCRLQNKSGGFYGSYGFRAGYFKHEEISWANKFFIDAVHLKIEAFFNKNATIFPTHIPENDGRMQTLRSFFGDISGKKILDAGCGKGRFAKRLKDLYPAADIHGVDISQALLSEVPKSIITRQGSIVNLPYESETFDGLFCIEALEHTIRLDQSIAELCRVVKNGGKIVVIDKNVKLLGCRQITDFEQWFSKTAVADLLGKYCTGVSAQAISHGEYDADGLFIAWTGIKTGGSLTADSWHSVMIGEQPIASTALKIRCNQFPVWIKPLLQHTRANDSVLELGCGTGELSAILALYDRKVHLLDYSLETVEHARALFKELSLDGTFYHGDILSGLPLDDNSIDWVWSSGLLEHFTDEQLAFIFKESFRVCRKGVMSLVPNAASLLYRVGKYQRECAGTWQYGKELPKLTLAPFTSAAGLKNVKEYSVGLYHPLNFWENESRPIIDFYAGLSGAEAQALNQGYLLFTYAEK